MKKTSQRGKNVLRPSSTLFSVEGKDEERAASQPNARERSLGQRKGKSGEQAQKKRRKETDAKE